MNAQAAQELLDLIMLDDYVARKQALDHWSQRWITTLYLEVPLPHAKSFESARLIMMTQIFDALAQDECHVLNFGLPTTPEGKLDQKKLAVEMHCVMFLPKDPGDITKAAKDMMDMAKGEKT